MNRLSRMNGAGLSVRLAAAALAVGLYAGSAWGQVRVSGLEHTPLGGATLGTPVERRLPVSNLGSSGQDGVEVKLNSRWGGAMSVDLDGLLAPSPEPREIRIRPKGWDGTIKGSMRLASRPPDGTPGSSMDLGCNFAQVGATTVRVTVRDQAGNVVLDGVRLGGSVQCVAQVVSPPGAQPSCRLAIKTKGLPVHRNQQISVALSEGLWTITGLSSDALHDVAVVEFEPEECSACDTWVGTESALITSVGLASMVVSDAGVGTFEVSSHALGAATVDEMCDDPTDCDDARRLHVSNIGSSGQDGVSIDLRKGSIGAAVTFDCFAGGLPVRPVAMEAWFDSSDGTGPVRMRVSREVDAASGMETITCDASEMDVTAIDVYCFDSSGAMLHSHREPTAVAAFACTAGAESRTQETWSCLHHRWVIDTSTPDTLVLVGGVSVPGVSSVSLVPRLRVGNVPVASRRLVMFGGQGTESIDIKHVNDPPTVVRVGGIQAIAMDKGLIAEQPDGSVIVSSPCCLDNDDDGDSVPDGIELRTTSTYGGGVTLNIAKLMENSSQNSREIRIRPKGWDGTIKGHIRMSSGGGGGAGGLFHLDADFSEMGAIEMQWEARDVDGALLASGTTAGPTIGGITVTPEPSTSLLMPALMKAKEKANRTKCSIVITDRDCGVDGLGTTTLNNVRSIEFTPIEPAGSPPWADLDAMQVTFRGMESLHVLDVSLLTFGVQGNGIKDVQVGEVCDDGNTCDTSRKIRVHNLGSEGQDGIQLRFGNPLITEVTIPPAGASFDMARGNCCRGHVIIMKLYDDQDQEAGRVSNSSDADQNTHTLSFDGSASGVEGFTFVFRSSTDDVLGLVDVFGSGGDISYIGPCDASETRTFSFNPTSIRMELCESPVTVFLGGIPIAGVSSVSMDCRTGMQWVPESLTGIDVIGNPTDFIEVSNFALIEGEPPCAADFDGDGTKTVADIFAFLAAWFAQQPAAYNFGGQTGVPAIFAFLAAWFAGCP